MNNILVLGSDGMLGYAVSEYFLRKGYSVKPLTINEFDITKDSMEKFESFLKNIEVVINCAGIIKPLIPKYSIEYILQVNSIFPRNLAKVCNKNNILCFHITTDCVYSGKKGNYNENDYFDATDVYGMTKNAGDIKYCMTLRTSIIGEEKGQQRSLLEWAKSQKGKEVNGFTNHTWNGITTLYLAEIIEKILNNNMFRKGVFHIFSPSPVTKYELLKIMNDMYNLELNINPIEFETLVDRTLISIYDLSKKLVTKDIKQQVFEMKHFFKK
ncbi:MAG: SDR family oxidoreductase [Candidatus Cloacimonetes bacterium]|nr:SDR family oxidoreductase [Candidatus Cloacimonadota bacterium]